MCIKIIWRILEKFCRFLVLTREWSAFYTQVIISCEELTHWKRLWCWEGLGAGGEGDDRGWDGWMASPTRWIWVWVNSGSWWWTGRPGGLRFMGSQSRTQLRDWTELNYLKIDWEAHGEKLALEKNKGKRKCSIWNEKISVSRKWWKMMVCLAGSMFSWHYQRSNLEREKIQEGSSHPMAICLVFKKVSYTAYFKNIFKEL